jgi:hypothetical protein
VIKIEHRSDPSPRISYPDLMEPTGSGREMSAASTGADIASPIETCKLCGVEPQSYLADIITRIVGGHLNSRIDDPLPWAYLAAPELKNVA